MRCLVAILGCLVALALLAVVMVWLFYVEEDARGAHAWEVAKKNLQDAGESVDYHDLIPPEIPDDQNLGAISLFQLEPDPDDHATMASLTLKKALLAISPGPEPLPKTGAWLKGEVTDIGPIEKYLSERYHKVFNRPQDNPGLTEEIDALCPALNDLRQAAATRPQCRFSRDYLTIPPYNRPFGSTTLLIKLSQVINLHAVAALHDKRSDVALEDIKATLKMDSGVRDEPILISGLVAAGMVSVQLDSVWEGLNEHAWTDQQLAELQHNFQDIDFLSDYQLCIHGEATGFTAQTFDYIRDHRTAAALVASMSNSGGSGHGPPLLARFFAWVTPRGWFDLAKARAMSLYYRAAREQVDSEERRVYSEKSDQFKQEGRSVHFFDLPDLLVTVASGPILNSAGNFAEVQFRVDAASIACALERYRLAHGSYPASLEALSSYAPKGLPHDLMNGEAYHYKLQPDGAYLLYSVGWNQVDDGGKVAYKPNDYSHALDREHGDWVWPCPTIK
jgi:hypothetical protein